MCFTHFANFLFFVLLNMCPRTLTLLELFSNFTLTFHPQSTHWIQHRTETKFKQRSQIYLLL